MGTRSLLATLDRSNDRNIASYAHLPWPRLRSDAELTLILARKPPSPDPDHAATISPSDPNYVAF